MGCGTSKPAVKGEESVLGSAPARAPVPVPQEAAKPATTPDIVPAAVPAAATVTEHAPAAVDVQPAVVPNGKALRVYVVYYSMYGHIEKLVRTLAEGLAEAGMDVKCFQVPEILPKEVLAKMHAPTKPADHPEISPSRLVEADAFVFAFPTRFGMMCSQFKSFMDATGGLWQKGELAGKPVTMMTSTGTQGGGQETTLLTAATQLVHHGMIIVPVGYTGGEPLFDTSEVRGGGPLGAGTFAGADGSRQPSGVELQMARHQGKYFGGVVQRLCA